MRKLGYWTGRYKKSLTVLLGLILACGAVGYYYAPIRSGSSSQEKTVTVKRGMVRSVVQATGSIVPVNPVDISSKVTGRILEVRVQENEFVRKGQVLVVLDGSHARTALEQAEAKLKNYTDDYARMQQLAQVGGIAVQKLDAARMNRDVARSCRDAAEADLLDTVIRAPIDGTVVGKPIAAGQTVSPGLSSPMVLLTLADISALQIEALADEANIGGVKVGQKAGFTVDSFPNKMFMGVISRISHKANVQQNVVYYTITVKFAPGKMPFKPGMTARVTAVTGERKNVLMLESAALRRDARQHLYVKAMVEGIVKDVPIQLGIEGSDRVEVAGGLNEGDTVIFPPGVKTGMSGLPGLGAPGSGHGH